MKKIRNGIALLLTVLLASLLCSCAGKTSNGDDTSGAKKTENGVKITATAAKRLHRQKNTATEISASQYRKAGK